jgi:hypothetical protein
MRRTARRCRGSGPSAGPVRPPLDRTGAATESPAAAAAREHAAAAPGKQEGAGERWRQGGGTGHLDAAIHLSAATAVRLRPSSAMHPPARAAAVLCGLRRSIGTFALPLAAQNVMGYSLNALSSSLIGRLGPSALSASTLGNSAYCISGLSLVWGGAAGLETLAGQVGRFVQKGALCRLAYVVLPYCPAQPRVQ